MPTVAEDWPFILLSVVASAIVAVIATLRWVARRRRLPYYSREFLLTKGEAAFYQVFRKVVPDGAALCFKVRLCDLIDCGADARRRGFWSKIAQKHIDFVLVDAASTAILVAVELDDRTHARKDRRERDVFVDGAMDVAGIPLMRVPAAAAYDPRALRAQLAEHLRRRRAPAAAA